MPQRRELGRSGLQVFPLCLGGNVFGWGADEAASHDVLDAYADGGGNFIDSANVYSAWVEGNSGGESEEIIGRWLRSRHDRDDMIVATKVGMAGAGLEEGLSRDQIRRGAEESLQRLGADRIDLYYAHRDDRATPLGETLAAFGELVDEGLVGTIAASNYSAKRLTEALEISAGEGLPRYEALQPHYNLLERDDYEGGPEQVCRDQGLGVAPYFSLARGFLTGKYRPGQPTPDSPRARGVIASFMNARGEAVLSALDAVSEAHDATPAQVSIAWLMQREGVTSPIASATTVAQVEDLLGAVAIELTADEFRTLDRAAVA